MHSLKMPAYFIEERYHIKKEEGEKLTHKEVENSYRS